MKKRIFRITILLSIIAIAFGLNGGFHFASKSSTVEAIGDLNVDWGVPHEGDPIFKIDNFAPGQTETREVTIINSASTVRPVGVRGIKTDEEGSLSERLNISILRNGSNLYTGNLAQFFEESAGPDGVKLFNANPGTNNKIIFKVTFDPAADNAFQDTKVVFDLKIGVAVTIPEECQHIQFDGDPIFGTEGKDNIRGTNGNDLIYGFEGDDIIQSSNGDDCVVGGLGGDILNNSNGADVSYGNEGSDRINGSNGNDLIFGGLGNDTIRGSNGDDIIYGGQGDDNIDGGNGDDFIYGESGDDELTGSNGNDRMFGGEGKDRLEGENGNDYLEGESGDDSLKGGNGSDTLLGGTGKDTGDGNLGTDSCDVEIKKNCE